MDTNAGNIAARSCNALHKSSGYWVCCCRYNRDRRRRGFEVQRQASRLRKDKVGVSVDDIAGHVGIVLGAPLARITLHHEVLALNVPKATQLLEKQAVISIIYTHVADFGRRANQRDALHLRRLLRTRCERPRRCCATEKRDELAPLHASP